jgi:hypothetical protein
MGFSLELRYLLLAYEAADGIAGLCPDAEPMLHAVGVQLYFCGFLQRIVRPYRLDNPPIARASTLNDYHTVERLLFLSNPGQTNSQH